MALNEKEEHDNLWMLQNRIARIFNVITQYEEKNFYLSFSGGMDSTVLSVLVDLALPDNKIPRVYVDTGIELNMIRQFVIETAKKDDRVVIIKPRLPIKKMLEEKGYPFKSKQHSMMHERFTRIGFSKGVTQYLGERTDKEAWSSQNSCPKLLKYQFHGEFSMKISDKCCDELKEKPIKKWCKENNKPYGIVGIMRAEGGDEVQLFACRFRGINYAIFNLWLWLRKIGKSGLLTNTTYKFVIFINRRIVLNERVVKDARLRITCKGN